MDVMGDVKIETTYHKTDFPTPAIFFLDLGNISVAKGIDLPFPWSQRYEFGAAAHSLRVAPPSNHEVVVFSCLSRAALCSIDGSGADFAIQFISCCR
jgi:hypothetical protein